MIRTTNCIKNLFASLLFIASCISSIALSDSKHKGDDADRKEFAKPIIDDDLVFEEKDGIVAIEAEHFYKQSKTEKRAWYLTTKESVPAVLPDGDSTHIAGASGGAYLELLPDTRRSHDDKLVQGENFSPEPGKQAVLTYKVHFNTPGTYWIWIRAYTTTSEDNGLHIGIDQEWPASSQRWQTVTRDRWHWESRQRTEKVHVGVPGILKLEVKKRGTHEIHLSMREDGIAIDRLLLVNRKDYEPKDLGPDSNVRRKGKLPSPFPYVAPSDTKSDRASDASKQTSAASSVPHSGSKAASPEVPAPIVVVPEVAPPKTASQVPAPSVPMAEAIDPKAPKPEVSAPKIRLPEVPVPQIAATEPSAAKRGAAINGETKPEVTKLPMPIGQDSRTVPAANFDYRGKGYGLDGNERLSINPNSHSKAKASIAFSFPSGRFHVTVQSVGEGDGSSTYTLSVNGSARESKSCPVANKTYDDSSAFWLTWNDVPIDSGDIIEVESTTNSKDGNDSSRGRWSGIVFEPSDEASRLALRSIPVPVWPSPSKPSISTVEPSSLPAPKGPALVEPRSANGVGTVRITGELRQWHKATLTLDGPFADERDRDPNPFTDYRMEVSWTHESGTPTYVVPGYFAADGNAAESGSTRGVKWRCHFAPDLVGRWTYMVHFHQGKEVALNGGGIALKPYDGHVGRILVEASSKTGRDFRAHGRLQYVGKRYLQFAGSHAYFLKVGADSPETLLAYEDFDNTIAGKASKVPLKNWQPHVSDWRSNDPTWCQGKGKGLVGALNYLSDQHVNAISFLTYNAGGDGDNVWPFVDRNEKLHYDCSKLDQWGIVFDHATRCGLYLHFKLQENETDDNRRGDQRNEGQSVPESLDGGLLGAERKLYCRELIARFGHALALNWNIGEENTQSSQEIRDMVAYLHNTDPYHHPIVIHTFPGQQEKVYRPLLGDASLLSGVSLQNPWGAVHSLTLQWIRESEAAERPWVVANDEQNSAATGVPADPGYEGSDGTAQMDGRKYSLHDIRKATLWGNLMAGGAGVEYYFGYKLPQNDLLLQDFRSRHQSWSYGKHALNFFSSHGIPIAEMISSDTLVGGDEKSNDRYCFAKPGEVYVVFLANGGTTKLDLSQTASRSFEVRWYNPRHGGELLSGSVTQVQGGGEVQLGNPPADPTEDWVILVR